MSNVAEEVILLGADGYLGRHVGQVLKQNERPFLAVGRREVSVDHHEPYLTASLSDLRSLVPALQAARFIYFFAGRTGTLDGFDRPDEFLNTNERGLLHLLNLIRQTDNRPRLVFPSTRLVYEGDSSRPLPENAPKHCRTIYAMNKLAGESYLRMYADLYGLPYTVFRICVPFGNSMPENNSYGTIHQFVAKARKGENLTIFGEGEQRRTLVHVEDLARIILEASHLLETKNSIFNVGGSDTLTITQVACKIAKQFGVDVTHIPWPETQQHIETGDTVFDDALLRQMYEPLYKWSFGRWVANLGIH